MSTSGDSSVDSPLQCFQTKLQACCGSPMEDIVGSFESAPPPPRPPPLERQYCKAVGRPRSTATTVVGPTTTTYHQRQPHGDPEASPAASLGGTPACSSDESQADLDYGGGLGGDGDEAGMLPQTREQKKYRRVQANKRERKRMHTVNSAFDDLRELVPTYPTNRKLSKIETLRLACAYIQDLAKLLKDSTAAVHGEDVNLQQQQQHHHCDGFGLPAPPAGAAIHPASYSPIKTEFSLQTGGDYSTCNFQHYRVPLSYDYESCPSDPEIQSPPNYHGVYMVPSGLAVKPPALARVSSDTAVALQMAQTSLNTGGSSGYCGSPAITPCSPLTRVQHSSPSQASRNLPSHFTAASYYNSIHQHPASSNNFAHCYSQ